MACSIILAFASCPPAGPGPQTSKSSVSLTQLWPGGSAARARTILAPNNMIAQKSKGFLKGFSTLIFSSINLKYRVGNSLICFGHKKWKSRVKRTNLKFSLLKKSEFPTLLKDSHKKKF